jgi:hypothetical protein
LVHREEGRNGGLLLKIGTLNFPGATGVSSFLIALPKNVVILNSSFLIITQNPRIRKG